VLKKILWAVLLSQTAGTALACDMPSLIVIPAKEQAAAEAEAVRTRVALYFEAMTAYTQCVQAELAAVGGDNAHPIVRSVLVRRNNAAVAETEAVLKWFTANVGPLEQIGPNPGPPPAN
jgi:hypothetical protein